MEPVTKWCPSCVALGREAMATIADLRARVAELERERDDLRRDIGPIMETCEQVKRERDEWHKTACDSAWAIARMTAERNDARAEQAGQQEGGGGD